MSEQNTIHSTNLEQLIHAIREKYIPDLRLDLFAIKIVEKDGEVMLTGKTSNHKAYLSLIDEAKKLHPNLKETIQVFPSKSVGEKIWGIVTNSVGDLRAEPAHSSELVTQVLLGMPVKVLDKKNDWLQVQASEGYIGWITLGSLHLQTKQEYNDYLGKPKVIVISQYGLSYSKPDTTSELVSDIVMGNMFVVETTFNNHYKVIYPDGREAYILRADALRVNDWQGKIKHTCESIIATAKLFMGIPYVWGGTSSKGLDCSGFVKMIYLMHGLIIARDASQQIKNGVEVDNEGNFDILKKGDLLFFGEKADEFAKERVVHVGIYIGKKEFIHASDNVHISSFDPESKLYDAYNTNRYLRSMRYRGYEDSRGIESIISHPFYTPHE